MWFLTVDELHVEVRAKRIAEGATKFLHQHDIEITHEHRRRIRLVNEMRPAPHVDRNASQ